MSTLTPDTQIFCAWLQDGIDRRHARLRRLWQMTATQRVAAMRRGQLTLEQLAAWTARHPDQVPLINGEFEWIATATTEICEGND